MGKFLERALNAVLGDVESSVRRDVERVTREARSSMPRGSLANSITSETRNGVTVRYGQGVMHVPSSVEFNLHKSIALGAPVELEASPGWSAPDEERYLMRKANGQPVISERREMPPALVLPFPMTLDPELLEDGWDDDGGFTSTLKRMAKEAAELDIEKDLHIRRFHRCGGYHEEPVTISTGETVAWLCRNCEYVRYAEGW